MHNLFVRTAHAQDHRSSHYLGAKAINCLLDSKWASGKGGTEILFTDRESVKVYLQEYAKPHFCIIKAHLKS
jgi:translocation protein SEC62